MHIFSVPRKLKANCPTVYTSANKTKCVLNPISALFAEKKVMFSTEHLFSAHILYITPISF